MHARLCPLPLAAFAAALLLAPPLAAQGVELKSATGLARNLSLTHTFLQVSDEIAKESGGKLRINYIGGPEANPPNKVAEALKRGLFDLLHAPASYYNGIIPEADALLVAERTPAELRANGGWDILQKIWGEKLGARILAWYEPGFQETGDAPVRDLYNLYFTRKPPLDPQKGINLTGFKMRSTATYRELFVALGATPVGMPNSEIYTGLQRGVVQGFGFPGVSITGLGLAGIVKYRVDPSFYKGNNLVLINLAKWNALPQDMRKLIETRFQAAETRSNIYVTGEAKKEEATMASGGMEIIKLEGDAAKSYLKTAYDEVWTRLEKRSPASIKDIRAKFSK